MIDFSKIFTTIVFEPQIHGSIQKKRHGINQLIFSPKIPLLIFVLNTQVLQPPSAQHLNMSQVLYTSIKYQLNEKWYFITLRLPIYSLSKHMKNK